MGARLGSLLFILCMSVSAGASIDAIRVPPAPESTETLPDFSLLRMGFNSVTPHEIFERTRWVLQQLGVAPERSYQGDLGQLEGLQSQSGITQILPYLDPHHQFHRFAGIQNANGQFLLTGFQDFDSKETEDFSVYLTSAPPPQTSLPLPPFTDSQRPLEGIRIALDPGHMGGDLWDERTGKYVTDHLGHKVSEGVINLQTALLLKERLEDLGASVMVTHEELGPVATVTWDQLKISDYAPAELEEESLAPWFLNLVASAPPGPQLYRAFKNSPHVRRLYGDDMRWDYFVLNADLEARAKKIKNFNPHLTLIIHYDTDDPPHDSVGINPYRHDFTKAYVPGGYEAEEFATRKDRALFTEHLLNPAAFRSSVNLAHDVLTALENGLNLKPDMGSAGQSVMIEPGLMARNLNLNRDLTGLAVAYVECLYYNDPVEFQAFMADDHEMEIGGVETHYSDRLVRVVSSLEKGILDYVQGTREWELQ